MPASTRAFVGVVALLLLTAAWPPAPAAATAGSTAHPVAGVPFRVAQIPPPEGATYTGVPPIPPGGDGLARISPALAGVPVVSPAADAAQAAYDVALNNLQAATALRIWAENELVRLAQRQVELTAEIGRLTEARKAAVVELATARTLLGELVVSAYVLSADHDSITRTFDLGRTLAIGATNATSGAVREEVLARVAAAEEAVRAASAGIDAAQAERVANRQLEAEVTTTRDEAAAAEVRHYYEAADRRFELEQARATAIVRGTDFTLVALDAFVRAADASGSCQLPWWALAGISRVEGRHGTYGGSQLRADGQVTVPIIGIPLSGAANTAVIGDSDGGALDGDVVWDRAVGPMQFIPSTWRRWAADGNGDGIADPQNMYDAVRAAAAYLCHGRRINTEADLRAGYFSYNRSEAYVENVLAHAYNYANLVIPEPPPPPAIPPRYPTTPVPADAAVATATPSG